MLSRNDIFSEYNEILTELIKDDDTSRYKAIQDLLHSSNMSSFTNEFDYTLWISLLEKIVVYSKTNIVFIFRNGSEIVSAL